MKRGMDPGLWFLKTFCCRLQSILEMYCIHFWAVWHMQAPQRKTLFRFKMHALLTMESSDHFMSTSTACDSLKLPCNENTRPLTSPPFFSLFFTLNCTALFITTWVFQINLGFQQISMSNIMVDRENKCQLRVWDCGRKKQLTANMNGEKNGQLVRVVSSFYLHVWITLFAMMGGFVLGHFALIFFKW
jgi:hypothetical protein